MDENGSDERPPFVGLGHEMGHSLAYDQGRVPPTEDISMREENAIRQEHGLPSRPNY